jgi:hypothetical protein
MSNALRGRINQLADRMEFAAECKLSMRPTKEQAADIRALLAAHRKAERELAIRRGIERELFALTEGMMDAQCPPWPDGDEPEDCPGDNCSKCWRKYFDGKLKPKKERRSERLRENISQLRCNRTR